MTPAPAPARPIFIDPLEEIEALRRARIACAHALDAMADLTDLTLHQLARSMLDGEDEDEAAE